MVTKFYCLKKIIAFAWAYRYVQIYMRMHFFLLISKNGWVNPSRLLRGSECLVASTDISDWFYGRQSPFSTKNSLCDTVNPAVHHARQSDRRLLCSGLWGKCASPLTSLLHFFFRFYNHHKFELWWLTLRTSIWRGRWQIHMAHSLSPWTMS